MKRIYLVRHGSTAGNEAKAYQVASLPLSDKGREQAQSLAQRFERLPVDVVIASDMERAAETARHIGVQTNCEVISEPLFHEILRPTAVRGREHNNPEVLELMKEVFHNWANPDWKHSDEENFFDLKERAAQAITYLEQRPEEYIAVVTHGTIMRMLYCVMCFGNDFSPELFRKVDVFLAHANTGLTVCEYQGQWNPDGWKLITWNDHVHLG